MRPSGKDRKLRAPLSPSIDRIDNRKGYVEGNCRLVCFIANLGRNDFTDAEFIEVCEAVAEMAMLRRLNQKYGLGG